jgi:hypothetical protein
MRHYYPANARLEVERQVFLSRPFRNRNAFSRMAASRVGLRNGQTEGGVMFPLAIEFARRLEHDLDDRVWFHR